MLRLALLLFVTGIVYGQDSVCGNYIYFKNPLQPKDFGIYKPLGVCAGSYSSALVPGYTSYMYMCVNSSTVEQRYYNTGSTCSGSYEVVGTYSASLLVDIKCGGTDCSIKTRRFFPCENTNSWADKIAVDGVCNGSYGISGYIGNVYTCTPSSATVTSYGGSVEAAECLTAPSSSTTYKNDTCGSDNYYTQIITCNSRP